MANLGSENFDNRTYENFCQLIYKKSGIVIGENKKIHLSNRLRARIKFLKLSSYEDYWKYVTAHLDNDSELYELLDAVSTNETYFQRGTNHFKILYTHILPEFYKKNYSHLSIWSCGTATGEEAYDLAMIACEFEKDHRGLEILITGTDISRKALEFARAGEYADRHIDLLSDYQAKTYFNEVKPEDSSLKYARRVLAVNEKIKNKVSFHYHNMISDSCLLKVDIIFCRNVLIYFNAETQKEVIDAFFRCLNPGGYLFIGPTESLQLIQSNLLMVKFEEGNVYKKQNGIAH
ncbi:MAG: protein-glutamate O-methyltransferase CheR [Spirochaetia bacterium]|nr:protein-glutamate O-methyltransferase CheR [Spirochaetia bacterium]